MLYNSFALMQSLVNEHKNRDRESSPVSCTGTDAYDNQGGEKRHHFTWILSGGDGPSEVEKIVIDIERVKFQIIVAKHETHPHLYNEKVDRFLQANADDELPFGALGIQSTTSTAHQTGAHTPTPQTPIYINQWRLGSGKFSIVNRVWDVSTGLLYASKEIFNMKESQWRREARVMSRVTQLRNVGCIPLLAKYSSHSLLGTYCTVCCFN